MYLERSVIVGLIDTLPGVRLGRCEAGRLILQPAVIASLLELERELEAPTGHAIARIRQLRLFRLGTERTARFVSHHAVAAILYDLAWDVTSFLWFVELMERAGFPDPDFTPAIPIPVPVTIDEYALIRPRGQMIYPPPEPPRY